jgi:hypothetical protein
MGFFNVVMRMTPYVEMSLLRLREVEVTSDGRRGLNARAVCKQLAATLPRVLRYDFAPGFKSALEAEGPGMPFHKSVDDIVVQDIRVSKEALVLQVGLKTHIAPTRNEGASAAPRQLTTARKG